MQWRYFNRYVQNLTYLIKYNMSNPSNVKPMYLEGLMMPRSLIKYSATISWQQWTVTMYFYVISGLNDVAKIFLFFVHVLHIHLSMSCIMRMIIIIIFQTFHTWNMSHLVAFVSRSFDLICNEWRWRMADFPLRENYTDWTKAA